MNSFPLLTAQLTRPEYQHVLLNPLPVYGLLFGVLALAFGASKGKSAPSGRAGRLVLAFRQRCIWEWPSAKEKLAAQL